MRWQRKQSGLRGSMPIVRLAVPVLSLMQKRGTLKHMQRLEAVANQVILLNHLQNLVRRKDQIQTTILGGLATGNVLTINPKRGTNGKATDESRKG